MRRFLFLVVLFLQFFYTYSQNNDIDFIRDLYNQTQKKINSQKDSLVPQDNMRIVLNRNMPAIGPQKISYKFYFTLCLNESDSVYYYHKLDFVKCSYNFAASAFYYEEFLFDNRANLVFYFLRYKSQITREYRCYFKDNKLIKITVKKLKENGNAENFNDYQQVFESTNKIPEYFRNDYAKINSKADDVLKIFKSVNNFDY